MKPARRTTNERPNSLAIDQSVLDALASKLEQPSGAGGNPAAAARAAVRLPFRRLSVRMSVLHADGTAASIVVACRNLSSGGIGIFHSAYMHVGSPCAVALPRNGKPDAVTRGTVVRCRHLGGRVHELGIKFTDAIDPRDFVDATAEDAGSVLASVRPAEFAAVVALRVDTDPLRREITRVLAETKATVRTLAPEPAAEAEPKPSERSQVLLAEMPMSGSVPEAVLKLAELSGGAPIVLIAPEDSAAARERVKEFACDGSVFPPMNTGSLVRALVVAMNLGGRGEALSAANPPVQKG
jgi:hypothetical protein